MITFTTVGPIQTERARYVPDRQKHDGDSWILAGRLRRAVHFSVVAGEPILAAETSQADGAAPDRSVTKAQSHRRDASFALT